MKMKNRGQGAEARIQNKKFEFSSRLRLLASESWFCGDPQKFVPQII
jgi:hypothetical protein